MRGHVLWVVLGTLCCTFKAGKTIARLQEDLWRPFWNLLAEFEI